MIGRELRTPGPIRAPGKTRGVAYKVLAVAGMGSPPGFGPAERQRSEWGGLPQRSRGGRVGRFAHQARNEVAAMPSNAVASEPVPNRADTTVRTTGGDRRSEAVERYFAAIQSEDYAVLEELLTPDAVTSWPQSGEQITGAMTCIRVYQNYPDGPPAARLARVAGEGDVRVAELRADYGVDPWYITSIFEFSGDRIARITDYFGPMLPAPDWRRQYVDPVDAVAPRADG
jgi:limonene-1,2-epoxide hydrolase